MVSEQKYHRSI